MALKIPKSFGAVKSKSSQTKGEGTRPDKKVIPKNQLPKALVTLSSYVLKRKDVVDLIDEA